MNVWINHIDMFLHKWRSQGIVKGLILWEPLMVANIYFYARYFRLDHREELLELRQMEIPVLGFLHSLDSYSSTFEIEVDVLIRVVSTWDLHMTLKMRLMCNLV